MDLSSILCTGISCRNDDNDSQGDADDDSCGDIDEHENDHDSDDCATDDSDDGNNDDHDIHDSDDEYLQVTVDHSTKLPSQRYDEQWFSCHHNLYTERLTQFSCITPHNDAHTHTMILKGLIDAQD